MSSRPPSHQVPNMRADRAASNSALGRHPARPTAPGLAADILEAFTVFHDAFRAATRRGADRFERRDWAGAESDAVERLALYRTGVDRTVAALTQALAGPQDPVLWSRAKESFARAIAGHDDA